MAPYKSVDARAVKERTPAKSVLLYNHLQTFQDIHAFFSFPHKSSWYLGRRYKCHKLKIVKIHWNSHGNCVDSVRY